MRWLKTLGARVLYCSLAVAAAVACAPASGKNKRPDYAPDPQPDTANADSAEWLFATGAVSGDRRQVCEHVRRVVLGEDQCAGASCQYASRLASDWLQACSKANPAATEEIATLQREFATRAERPATPCGEQIRVMLSEGCREGTDCLGQAQDWVTRCGPGEATPLVILMLEKTIEQTQGDALPVKLDRRSCADMADELHAAARCGQRFKCEDLLPKIEQYHSRCIRPNSPALHPTTAVAQAAILQGAERKLEPIAVSMKPKRLPSDTVPVRLQSGAGVILRVCGQRVLDVPGYVMARGQCQDGEVVVAHLFVADKQQRKLRVGSIPHPDDLTFMQRFPTLRVPDEIKIREPSALSLFGSGLDAATKAGTTGLSSGLSKLVATLASYRPWFDTSEAFGRALRERDAALVPLFTELAAAKTRAPNLRTRARDLVPFARRAQTHPLADVSEAGKVQIGASNLVSDLELGQLLPRAVAAYQQAVRKGLLRVQGMKLQLSHQQSLANEAKRLAESCTEAQGRFRSNQQALLGCYFEVGECSEQRLAQLTTDLDAARLEAARARVGSKLAVASLGDDATELAGSVLERAHCAGPGW